MAKQRRTFTATEKVAILRRHLLDGVAVSDLRDEVCDYVREWSEKTGLPATRLVNGLGLSRGKYYDWRRRYGKVNEHNGWIPHSRHDQGEAPGAV